MIGNEYKGTRVDGDGDDQDGAEAYEMKGISMQDEPESTDTKDAGKDPGVDLDAERNVLRGRTLGMFGADSVLRKGVYAFLMHP
jgi:hypothetical protein